MKVPVMLMRTDFVMIPTFYKCLCIGHWCAVYGLSVMITLFVVQELRDPLDNLLDGQSKEDRREKGKLPEGDK